MKNKGYTARPDGVGALTQSYVHGAGTTPLLGKTLGVVFDEAVARWGDAEEFIYQHPKIEQVEVFGVPDPKYGETVCAWILLREGETATEDEIRAFCQEHIAYYKVPRYIRFVDAFPLTVIGKVQKFKMRSIMADELGLMEEATA